MQHDGINNVCINSQRIMAPSAGGQDESFLWSSCSAGYLDSFLRWYLTSSYIASIFLENRFGNSACLRDTPAEGEFEVNATNLVGLEFGADEQCRAQYGPSAVFCPFNFAIEVSYDHYNNS